ncbi:MAG: hypothetical protein ABIP58_09315 [Dehalococcoidia bacterium]
MTDDDAASTLKCIIAWSPRRNLCTIIAGQLADMVPQTGIRPLGDDAHIVYTPLNAEQLRDALRDQLTPDEALLVTEFEAWSGYGQSLDAKWLLAHGH